VSSLEDFHFPALFVGLLLVHGVLSDSDIYVISECGQKMIHLLLWITDFISLPTKALNLFLAHFSIIPTYLPTYLPTYHAF